MTDRELIELAAKAAGIEIYTWQDDMAWVSYGPSIAAPWSPLESDADAFRLAVKLRLETNISEAGDVCSASSKRVLSFADGDMDSGDECVLMRLAITRAAAEIGKARYLAMDMASQGEG